jgi:integrase
MPFKNPKPSIPPSPQKPSQEATSHKFRFSQKHGDTMGDIRKKYKKARLNSTSTKWFVYYYFRNPETNKFKRFRVYEDLNRLKDPGEKLAYAKQLISDVNYALEKIKYNPFEEKPKPVLSVKNWTVYQGLNYFKQKLEDRGLRPKTVVTYTTALRLLEALPNIPINDLDENTCENLLQSLAKKRSWSNSTFNNTLTNFRIIFGWMRKKKITNNNPFTDITPLKEHVTRHKAFDDETFQLVKKNAPPDLLRFMMFVYHTATRENEARQLRYDHILRDRKDPVLFVPSSISKNNKDFYIPVSEDFVKEFQGEGLIFGTKPDHFGKKFTLLKRKLGLDKNHTLYATKHTRAIHLAEAGVSIYAIMQFFRHSSPDMTMIYLRSLGLSIGREAAQVAKF